MLLSGRLDHAPVDAPVAVLSTFVVVRVRPKQPGAARDYGGDRKQNRRQK